MTKEQADLPCFLSIYHKGNDELRQERIDKIGLFGANVHRKMQKSEKCADEICKLFIQDCSQKGYNSDKEKEQGLILLGKRRKRDAHEYADGFDASEKETIVETNLTEQGDILPDSSCRYLVHCDLLSSAGRLGACV